MDNNRSRLVRFFSEFAPGKSDFAAMREDYIAALKEGERPVFYNDVTQIMRNYLLLDHVMNLPLRKGQKVSRANRAVVFCALYDILFRDQPPHVVNEFINLVKHKKDKGFINWLLRTVLQETGGKKEGIPLPTAKIKELSIKYSFPVDFTVKLSKEMNKRKTEEIFKVLSREVPSVYMPNLFSPELAKLNCKEVMPGVREICDMKEALEEQRAGRLAIFEKTSIYPVYLLDPREGEEILDLCAAPGNKGYMMYNLSEGKISLTLNDLSSGRYDAMKDNLKRWNMDLQTTNLDGRKYPTDRKYDAVLVDAPCTNTGVISKKPDVKFKLKNTKLNKLKNLQLGLIMRGLELLKPGGRLVYAVCSFMTEEIAPIVESVEKNTDFVSVLEPVHQRFDKFREEKFFRIIPSEEDPVGFSFALFKRKE